MLAHLVDYVSTVVRRMLNIRMVYYDIERAQSIISGNGHHIIYIYDQ